MTFRFTSDDEVIYADKHRARVLYTDASGNVRIEFENIDLMPRQMTVPESYLRHPFNSKAINAKARCPKCDVPWKPIELAHSFVFDCPKCGAKKEDYC